MSVPHFVVGLTLLCLGCGEGPPSTAGKSSTADEGQSAANTVINPPPAAISQSGVTPQSSRIAVEPGSPEAKLLEITKLIAAANADAERQQGSQPESDAADSAADLTSQRAAADYRKRLEQIIALATEVIAATHLDPKQEQAFNNGVHYLSDARLELASAGDASQAQLLIEDADSLFERDKTSFAAAEAGYKVVELAERMARTLGDEDPDWLREHANQAQRFAERFPQEQNRAAMALFTAGRLSDRFGQFDTARTCLQLVQQQFSDTVFADQSAGILRRLSLEGQSLELAGPTIEGGMADIEQYRGQVVLVVFWATTSPSFRDQLAAIKQAESQFSDAGLAIIGVNLDTDEPNVDQFLAEQQIAWPQVFAADPAQRGGRNPVARYYGVQVLPTYWLVDRRGTVVETQLPADELVARISGLIKKS